MKVPVLDHLIITETSYYSFAANGLLKELEASTRYVPAYELKRRYEKAALEKGKEVGEKRKAKEMAKAMKKEGMSLELIVKITGLTKATINKLKVEKE
jgi:DNA repair protein RadC